MGWCTFFEEVVGRGFPDKQKASGEEDGRKEDQAVVPDPPGNRQDVLPGCEEDGYAPDSEHHDQGPGSEPLAADFVEVGQGRGEEGSSEEAKEEEAGVGEEGRKGVEETGQG